MNSLQKIRTELKQAIYNDYISGMDMEEIAKKYKFKYIRTCYYHLQPLSYDSKIQHMINKSRRLKAQEKNESTITS